MLSLYFKGYYKIFSEIFQSIKVRKEIFIKVNIAIKTITILKVYSIPKITRVLKLSIINYIHYLLHVSGSLNVQKVDII